MMIRNSVYIVSMLLLILITTRCQNSAKEPIETAATNQNSNSPLTEEPHQYGGWNCPDNFGFVPVDIQKLNEMMVVSDRLPTKEELLKNMSLIEVDTKKYPDARALKMELPRVARIATNRIGIAELIIVIQAIVVQNDTIVGYRYPNGGNGSAKISNVSFLTKDEVAAMGPQPFFYSKSVFKASTKEIWKAISKTDYFKQLGKKFDKKEFFSSDWNARAEAFLKLDTDEEKANGYVGEVFGNYYLQIDYNRNGFHFSEKMLMIENKNDHTTEFFFTSGPYPKDYEKRKIDFEKWIDSLKQFSETK